MNISPFQNDTTFLVKRKITIDKSTSFRIFSIVYIYYISYIRAMTFEDFTKKLSVIQANSYLSIDDTIDIKRKVVGSEKKLWKCTGDELLKIMQEYRKEYKKQKFPRNNVYSKRDYAKSKHKYSSRKDWD